MSSLAEVQAVLAASSPLRLRMRSAAIGSYPFFDPKRRAQHECGAARPRCTEARAGQTWGRGESECGGHNQRAPEPRGADAS